MMTWLGISAAVLIGFALGAALGYPWGFRGGFGKAVAIGLGLEMAALALDKAHDLRVANTRTAAGMALAARTTSKIKN